MKKLSEIDFRNAGIGFGEEHPIDGLELSGAMIIPVTVNGREYPEDEITLTVEPTEINGKVLYRPDLHMDDRLRGKGLGYAILKSFILTFGHMFAPQRFITNKTVIPKIMDRLSDEPDINVRKTGDYYFAYSDMWKEKYGDNI